MDPGKDGAIVVIQGDEVIKHIFPMIGNEYDIHAFKSIFATFDKDNCHVIVEDVSPIPGGSAKANWSFSRGKTILEVLTIAYDLPFTMVRPKAWQKVVHQGIPRLDTAKQMTLLAVKRLYPDVDLRKTERSKKPHDGTYDALAMAHYCKVTYGIT